MDLKFCKDCKHAEPLGGKDGPSTLICQHEDSRIYNLVTGAYTQLACHHARAPFHMENGNYAICQPEGKLFEPREDGALRP